MFFSNFKRYYCYFRVFVIPSLIAPSIEKILYKEFVFDLSLAKIYWVWYEYTLSFEQQLQEWIFRLDGMNLISRISSASFFSMGRSAQLLSKLPVSINYRCKLVNTIRWGVFQWKSSSIFSCCFSGYFQLRTHLNYENK